MSVGFPEFREEGAGGLVCCGKDPSHPPRSFVPEGDYRVPGSLIFQRLIEMGKNHHVELKSLGLMHGHDPDPGPGGILHPLAFHEANEVPGPEGLLPVPPEPQLHKLKEPGPLPLIAG